jgi:hypothetical protein
MKTHRTAIPCNNLFKEENMKRSMVLMSGVLVLMSAFALSQAQSQPSSAESNGVRVYSSQGYQVNAVNSNNYACNYSFKYTITGYDNSGNIVNRTEKTVEDSWLDAGEERSLFTTPIDPYGKITYWITINEVYNVKKA